MTSPTPSDVFKQYCHRLQLAAPQEWEQLVQCFDAYATDVTVAVTNADQSEILVKQGQAQAFLHLLRIMRTCHIQKPPPSTQPPSP